MPLVARPAAAFGTLARVTWRGVACARAGGGGSTRVKCSRIIRERLGGADQIMLPHGRASPSPAQQKSKITNGARTHLHPRLGGPDLRSRTARRWRDLYLGFSSELGRTPSTVDDSLLRSAADLQLAHERLSAQIAGGAAIDAEELTRISGALRRVLSMLGLARREGVAATGGPALELGNLLGNGS
jgi:hypothetical protein